MKKQHWFLVIGSFILGLAAGFSVFQLGLYNDPSENMAVEPEADKWLETEAMLLDRIREKDAEIARLKANVNQAPEAVMKTAAEPVEEDFLPEVNTPDDRRVSFLERMEERIDQRTATMVETYGLNEEQAAALNAVFQKQFEMFRARRRGEVVEPFSLDEAIAAIMTEEQFSKYLEDSQQEILERAEVIATTQLVRMSQRMELSPEVQDEVYETLNYTAQEMMIARQNGEDFDLRTEVESRLGSFLTVEQMQIYRESARVFPGPGPGRGPGP